MERFQRVSKKVLDRASECKGKIVGGAIAGSAFLGSNLMAAAVALPANSQADIEESVQNGGTLLITVTVLILGYMVITRMIKRT